VTDVIRKETEDKRRTISERISRFEASKEATESIALVCSFFLASFLYLFDHVFFNFCLIVQGRCAVN
jgi:hypothetical protein